MPRIPESEIERIKRQTDLAALARSRGVELKPHGRKDLIGRCPFHEDKNPSFVVSPDKNLFHCLGCNAAGSVIDLVMKLDKVGFRAAVDKILGVAPQIKHAGTPKPAPPKPSLPVERATQLIERVIAVYEKTFSEVSDGKAYLEKRGVTDAGLFIQHQTGFSNGTLCNLLPKDGQLKEELKTIGILLDNGHERFTGCVVFPVYDSDGNLTTIYGRFIHPANGGTGANKRHLFLPDRSTGLWNAVAMKTYSEIILVESVIDALSVMMAGRRNVIAIQGTNGLDEADIRTLKTHGVQAVTLLLDGDEAGKKAAERLKEKLSLSFSCRLLSLPDGNDPNGFLVRHGAQKLAGFIAANIAAESEEKFPAVRADGGNGRIPPALASGAFVVTCGLRRYEVRGLEKGARRLKATIRVEHAGKLHVDTLDFYSARSRRILAMDICRIFEETPETIEADVAKLLRHCEQIPDAVLSAEALAKAEARPVEATLTPGERAEAEGFGKSPDLVEKILADFETCGLIGEESNKLLGYIAMTSRKRDAPLSVLILSGSGAGKTALQDTVVSFCPPEDLVKLTALSGKALFYKERLSLKHKVLALEEGDGAKEASYAIRNLISAKELVSESTIKDLATGRLTTMENKVEGPSSVFLTTTNPEIDPETRSRFFVTSVDESREQTRRILLFQRQLHQSDSLIATPEIEAILKKHRNFQRLLKPMAVKNPFAGKLTYGDDRLQGRRDQPKYLNLIKAVAFLRQLKKEIRYEQKSGNAVPYIDVDREDVKLANKLAHEILGHSLDELSRPGHDLLIQLEEMANERLKATFKQNPDGKMKTTDISFSRRDIREFTGWTNTRLHIHLKELVDFEYVIIEAGRNGLPFRYRLAYEGQGKDGKRFMLGLADVDGLSTEGGSASGGKDVDDLADPDGKEPKK